MDKSDTIINNDFDLDAYGIKHRELVDFFNAKIKNDKSESNIVKKITHLQMFSAFLTEKNYEFCRADKKVIDEYKLVLRKKLGDAPPRTALNNMNFNLSTIKQCYMYYTKMVDNDYIKNNFYDPRMNDLDQDVFRMKAEEKSYYLITPAVAKKIIDELPTWRDILIFKLMYLNGFTINLISEITIADVMSAFSNGGRIVKTMENGRILIQEIRSDLLNELIEYIDNERKWYGNNSDYLFVTQGNQVGLQINSRIMRYEFQKVSTTLGIKFNFSDIKNSYFEYLILYNEVPMEL